MKLRQKRSRASSAWRTWDLPFSAIDDAESGQKRWLRLSAVYQIFKIKSL